MSDSATSTTASTAVYQRVSRTRTESSMALPDWRSGLGARPRRSTFVGRVGDIRIDLRAKEVAGAAAGMEQGLAGISVNFPAHAIHVNFDQIREGIEGLIPHVFGDIRAPYNAAGVAGKIFEQRIFLGGERHGPPRPGNALRGGIQDEVGDDNFGGAELTGAAQQRTKTRKQLAEFEWLGEVIVRAVIEAGDAVLDGIARGQHQNGHALARFSELAANFKTVAARNHHVEDHQVVSIDRGLIEGVVAGTGNIDGVRLFAQALGHESRDARIVFDKQ